MKRPDIDLATLHQAWRMFFGGFLILALAVGLYLSFQPSGFDQDAEVVLDESTQPPADAGDAADEEIPEDTADPPGDEESELEQEDEMTQEEAEVLIAAARDPSETSVQVLDAGGGADATQDAAETLAELGYDVVAVNSSRTDYSVTTVLFTDGNEAEAQALPARDPRFVDTAPNERLSEDVDLHVVVGPDWE